MKPLVLWCRWHDVVLRLRGRDNTAVWGELAFLEENKPFHFNLQSRQLTIGTEPDQEVLVLDEMGVAVEE